MYEDFRQMAHQERSTLFEENERLLEEMRKSILESLVYTAIVVVLTVLVFFNLGTSIAWGIIAVQWAVLAYDWTKGPKGQFRRNSRQVKANSARVDEIAIEIEGLYQQERDNIYLDAELERFNREQGSTG